MKRLRSIARAVVRGVYLFAILVQPIAAMIVSAFLGALASALLARWLA